MADHAFWPVTAKGRDMLDRPHVRKALGIATGDAMSAVRVACVELRG